MKPLQYCSLCLLSCVPLLALGSSRSELIFAVGSTGFPASHASTLVELRSGELMAAWFGGTAEGNPDVAIWGSRHDDAGWSTPAELVREPHTPCWNPVLFHTMDGRLWLYYKFGTSIGIWAAGRRFSMDEGRTWSPVEHLPAGLIGPVRTKPLILANGAIVSGTSVEAYLSWAAWIERSTDNGATWTKFGPIETTPQPTPPSILIGSTDEKAAPTAQAPTGLIQPSVVPLGGSHLRLYARSTSDIGRIVAADSADNGVTWTQGHPLALPNPNSGIDAVTLKDGRIVIIFNNTQVGRTPLNLAVSLDGENFEIFRTLENEAGEFSYPAIIQSRDGNLEMTYTWNRKTIQHVHLDLREVPTPRRTKPH